MPSKLAVVAVGSKSHHQDKTSFAQRCSNEWLATRGGDWSTSKDWSTGAVPSSTGATCITLAGSKSYTVTLSNKTNSTTVGSLILGATSGKREASGVRGDQNARRDTAHVGRLR